MIKIKCPISANTSTKKKVKPIFTHTSIYVVIFFVFFSCSTDQETRPNILICVADDHSFQHTSKNGCKFVNTPAFDEVAHAGIYFTNAFASAPSCAPSRASILTGKPFYLTSSASMNHGFWANDIRPYTSLLKEAGYYVGYTGKSWGPGQYLRNDMDNAAGKAYNNIENPTPSESISRTDYYRNFEKFLEDRKPSQPFHFWFGPSEPHRPFEYGIGKKNGKNPDLVTPPQYYPNVEEVRNDILDYAFEIEWKDRHLGKMIQKLKEIGELENTIIIVTSDHGMAFPRAKTSCYDAGLHVPLAIMWPQAIKPNRQVDDFINLYDIAPTLLETAELSIPKDMLGKSLLNVFKSNASGQVEPQRNFVICGLERHGGVRTGGPDYPIRTYRTENYLFIKNYSPENPPAGYYPSITWPRNDTVRGYGYVDGSPTKTALYYQRDKYLEQFKLCLEKRPQYELYDVLQDPDQIHNLAYDGNMESKVKQFEAIMEGVLKKQGDPRLNGDEAYFENIRSEIIRRLATD